MTNKEKIATLTAQELSLFVCEKAEKIYRRYSQSAIGFEEWLKQPYDKEFWQEE